MKAKKTAKKEINYASACNISRTIYTPSAVKPMEWIDKKTGKR